MEPTTLCWISSTIAVVAAGSCCYLYVKNKRAVSTKDSDESKNKPKQKSIKKVTTPIHVVPSPNVPAKDAILLNIDNLVPLLDGVEDGTLDIDAWSDAIISINNEELISIWKKVYKKPELWLHLLSSWGITYDNCMQFIASEYRKNLYESIDGEVLVEGQTYKVIKGTWILTSLEGSKKFCAKVRLKL